MIQFCGPSECVGRGGSRLNFLDRGGPSSSAPALLLIRPLGELAPCASPASDAVCALQKESSRRSEGTNTRRTIWTVQGSMLAGDDGKLMIQRERGCGPHARRRRYRNGASQQHLSSCTVQKKSDRSCHTQPSDDLCTPLPTPRPLHVVKKTSENDAEWPKRQVRMF